MENLRKKGHISAPQVPSTSGARGMHGDLQPYQNCPLWERAHSIEENHERLGKEKSMMTWCKNKRYLALRVRSSTNMKQNSFSACNSLTRPTMVQCHYENSQVVLVLHSQTRLFSVFRCR